MKPGRSKSGRNGKLSFFVVLASFCLIVGALHWGRPILMPLAMAVLLTFILAPAVTLLRRCHLRHTFAVVAVVILAFSLLGAVLLGIGRQINSLALELPEHEENIREKIHDLRGAFQSMAIDRVRHVLQELRGEFNSPNGSAPSPQTDVATANGTPPTSVPTPATTADPPDPEPDGPSLLTRLVGPISNVSITAGLVIALVVFMLLRRDELRNRLILLGGIEQLPVTTRILREAGQRISRYLLTYTLLNAIYGVAVGVGLFLIGLPYALLWGFFAGVVRFIPYVGPWIGAVLPALFALAVFPGWVQPLLVIALYIGAELTSNMVLEPIFYGQSAGVSELALLIALAFWTWVWGPVGLLLGTPLTVCLVVLAKYIPALEWFHLLLGDGPVEERCLLYYERLRARNDEDAETIVRDHLRASSTLRVFDELLLPALIFARRDLRRGRLAVETNQHITGSIRRAIDLASGEGASVDASNAAPASTEQSLIGLPAGDESEELALLMLKRALENSGVSMDVLSWKLSPDDSAAAVIRRRPHIVCVAALVPDAPKRLQRSVTALRSAGYADSIITAECGISQHIDGRLVRVLGAKYRGGQLMETHSAILRALNQPLRNRPQSASSAILTEGRGENSPKRFAL